MLAKLLLSLLALLGAWAVHAERITWLMPEFALAESNAAKLPARKGMAEPMLDELKKHWPEPAEHVAVLANAKRSWLMIEAGEPACHLVSLRTPEREARAFFYITHLLPPAQLVALPEVLARLPRNAQGEVGLSQVLQSAQLQGALIEGRSYGAALDAQLAQRPPQSVALYAPVQFGSKLLQMVALGRGDYTIEYDFVLAAQRAQWPLLQKLETAPIQGASEMLQAGVACPRNDWGRAVIARAERILARREALTQMQRDVDAWMTPQARRFYGARMDAFLAERLRKAPQ
ncbi:hypothetical protein [Paucibacter soli]|uniref:hypothetical protein n=1 Tax=Paucibacter soli TaxID=3133433 RepID=UPI0030969EFC